MRFFAQSFHALQQAGILDQVHVPLFNAVQAEQRHLGSPRAIADFVAELGFDPERFIQAFRSTEVREAIAEAERKVDQYSLSGVPQFIVNGKYRVDPVRAGGRREMLDVVEYLVNRERASSRDGQTAGR